jgi:N-methylhydantoinase A
MSLGIDEGGTFTDFVFVSPEDGEIRIAKVGSRDKETFGVFLEGLSQIGLSLKDVDRLVYGTTVGTNAIVERKGAEIGLLCTKGFRDILDHQRWHQRVNYDLHQTRPAALVRRRYRCQITERTSGYGEVLIEPDPEELVRALDFLASVKVNSVAVAFLNSYANGHNEEVVGRILRDHGLRYVSLSSEIAPFINEWERTNTAALNAYIQPIIDAHVGHLQEEIGRHAPDVNLIVMQSNGGGISADQAVHLAVRTARSGPAGGVAGAKVIAEAAGFSNVITLDMGGTSCDVSVITNGKEEVTKEGDLGYNMPVRAPMISIHTIGAGGGSLAYVDEGGSLKVGPKSAGAVPGPACYGRGGEQATVTDAHLLLDHLPADGLIGGKMALDRALAEAAIGELGDKLALSTTRTAMGILRIANTVMAQAVKLMTVDRGLDPRDYCLLAFGGMAPMHACDIASELGMDNVLIPRLPGVLSALGLAIADLKVEAARSINKPVDNLSPEEMLGIYENLKVACDTRINEQRVAGDSREFLWTADMRYPGQTFDIAVPLKPADFQDGFAGLIDRFHEYHENVYAYSIRDQLPVLVAAEVIGIAPLSQHTRMLPRLPQATSDAQPRGRRQARIGDEHLRDISVFARSDLLPGHTIAGPALIEQEDSTVVISPGWIGRVDEFGNLVLGKEA